MSLTRVTFRLVPCPDDPPSLSRSPCRGGALCAQSARPRSAAASQAQDRGDFSADDRHPGRRRRPNKDGKLVTDLSAKDFELREDDAAQEVGSFTP